MENCFRSRKLVHYLKITNSIEKNGYPQLIQDCNASAIKEILERVLHPITGKFDSAITTLSPSDTSTLLSSGSCPVSACMYSGSMYRIESESGITSRFPLVTWIPVVTRARVIVRSLHPDRTSPRSAEDRIPVFLWGICRAIALCNYPHPNDQRAMQPCCPSLWA